MYIFEKLLEVIMIFPLVIKMNMKHKDAEEMKELNIIESVFHIQLVGSSHFFLNHWIRLIFL